MRPIAVGDVLQRLTARYLCFQFKGRFKDHFSPIQHGVATGGGIELVANHVKLTLESHHNWILLKLDTKNAVNSISRSHCLKEVQASFTSLLPHIFQMYERENHLVYQMGNQSVIVKSLEGVQVHQGDPLGPAIFSVGIHPILNQVQEGHPTRQHIYTCASALVVCGAAHRISEKQTCKSTLLVMYLVF